MATEIQFLAKVIEVLTGGDKALGDWARQMVMHQLNPVVQPDPGPPPALKVLVPGLPIQGGTAARARENSWRKDEAGEPPITDGQYDVMKVPQSVSAAAALVGDYFKTHDVKGWQLQGLQEIPTPSVTPTARETTASITRSHQRFEVAKDIMTSWFSDFDGPSGVQSRARISVSAADALLAELEK